MLYIHRQIYNLKEKVLSIKLGFGEGGFFDCKTNCSSTKVLHLLMQMHSLSPVGVEQKDTWEQILQGVAYSMLYILLRIPH